MSILTLYHLYAVLLRKTSYTLQCDRRGGYPLFGCLMLRMTAALYSPSEMIRSVRYHQLGALRALALPQEPNGYITGLG